MLLLERNKIMDLQDLSLAELVSVEGGGLVDTIGGLVDSAYLALIRAAVG
jgi:hypothetical protein